MQLQADPLPASTDRGPPDLHKRQTKVEQAWLLPSARHAEPMFPS